MQKLILSTAGIVTCAVSSMAHSGHGLAGAADLAHYLVEPIHAWPWVLVIALAVLMRRSRRTAKARR